MKTFEIWNTVEGTNHGRHVAESPRDALDVFARDKGFDDWRALVVAKSPIAAPDEIAIVDENEVIWILDADGDSVKHFVPREKAAHR